MQAVTILSHNTFWFQGAPFPTDIPPEPEAEVLKRLCAIYKEIKADVICLQEIQSRDAFEIVSGQLEMPGCYCPGTMLPQYGGAVFWRPGQGSLAYDSQTASRATQRMWQIVDINNGDSRLRVGNIHLPSSRQLGPQDAQQQRIAELGDAISIREIRPDVILGDFNEQPGGRIDEFLKSYAYIDAAVLTERADMPTNLGAGRGDYVWIKKQHERRLVTYNVMQKTKLACQILNKEYLSDHLPLWITL